MGDHVNIEERGGIKNWALKMAAYFTPLFFFFGRNSGNSSGKNAPAYNPPPQSPTMGGGSQDPGSSAVPQVLDNNGACPLVDEIQEALANNNADTAATPLIVDQRNTDGPQIPAKGLTL